MGVADRHRCVTVLFLHHQLCHGLADDVAAAENDTFPAGSFDFVMLQERQDSQRGR